MKVFAIDPVQIGLYRSGVTAEALSRQLEVSESTILRALRKQGVAIRPRSHQPLILTSEQLKAYQDGRCSTHDLAFSTGFDKNTVARALRRQGVSVRTIAEGNILSAKRRKLTRER